MSAQTPPHITRTQLLTRSPRSTPSPVPLPLLIANSRKWFLINNVLNWLRCFTMAKPNISRAETEEPFNWMFHGKKKLVRILYCICYVCDLYMYPSWLASSTRAPTAHVSPRCHFYIRLGYRSRRLRVSSLCRTLNIRNVTYTIHYI